MQVLGGGLTFCDTMYEGLGKTDRYFSVTEGGGGQKNLQICIYDWPLTIFLWNKLYVVNGFMKKMITFDSNCSFNNYYDNYDIY